LLFAVFVITVVAITAPSNAGEPRQMLLAVVTALGFLSAAEYGFTAAHLLWQRFEFVSEVIWIKYFGGINVSDRQISDKVVVQAGTQSTASGMRSRLAEISGPTLSVSHFTVRSVCYTLNDVRIATDIVIHPDTARAIEAVILDSIMEVQDTDIRTAHAEREVRTAYEGPLLTSHAATAVPALIEPMMDIPDDTRN
jgi:hypothetical protein